MDDITSLLKENFTGRICTILTRPVSFAFKDVMQHAEFFTGRVERIDEFGIWLRHMNKNTIAFYPFPIIGIVEEEVIPPDDPRAEKLKEAMKKKEAPKPMPQKQFIPIESLTKMVRDANSGSSI